MAARTDAIITAGLRPELFAERGLVSVNRTLLVVLLAVLCLVGFGFRVSGVSAEGKDQRSRLQNLSKALERLREKLQRRAYRPPPRKKTRPSAGVKRTPRTSAR